MSYYLLALILITGTAVFMHLMWLLFRHLLKDNSYNQNLWLREGRFVTGDAYRDIIPLMNLSQIHDRTLLPGTMPEKVTSSFSAIYIRLYQMETGECFDSYLESSLLIGRGDGRVQEGVLQLYDPMVSQKHCQLFRKGNQILIQDLGSTNHTFVNGCQVENTIPVSHGDMLGIGSYVYQFQCYYQR